MQRVFPHDRAFRVIDIGAGAGFLGQYLARDFPSAEYHFIEPISSLESVLETRYGADRNAKHGGTCASTDFVTLLDVVEHQDDDGTFVDSVAARMDPGATLVATVPAFHALWSHWDVALGHHRRYVRPQLAALFDGHGFDVVSCNYLFPELVAPGAWRAIQSRMRKEVPADTASSEFPDVPGWLNGLLFWGGRVTLAGRRWWPLGTSIIAVARRR